MKKYLFSLLFILVSYVGFSQKGLSYQAVVINPNAIPLAGEDVTGQPLVNGDVWMKFQLYNGSTLQFEEVHQTKTDAYGLVNLMIGSVSSASFNSIVWDANQKSLLVFASFNQGSSYTKVSEQKLTYSPYSLFAETAGKLGGVLGIEGGGTGATTAADARTNIGLKNVDNTADLDKPVSNATKAALDLKANVSEMSASLGAKADTANVKTALALKANATDVDAALALKANTADITTALAAATIADADTSTKGKIQLAGDLGGTAAAPTVPGLALKANTADVTAALALKANSSDVNSALAAKVDSAFVLAKVAAATIADADATTKGKIQLAGDLGGTAAAPTVPGLALKANAADVTAALALKANSSDVNSALASKVDSAFVLAKVVATSIADADATTKGKIQLAGDLGGTAAAPTVPGLALKANTADITTSLATKVDKVTGKDLSSNDYTTPEKDKLAAITGTNTGDQINITGNAATATKLATAKNINGVAFDGSTDITVTADAGTLTGTTLASNVVNSSLTSVGTLTSGTISLTTDIVTSGNLKAGAITYPNTAGTNGQVLTSNGAGNATWISPTTVSVGTISSTSNANGATITSGVLNLTPADETNGGIITTGTQSFAGLKTFKDGINYIKVSNSSTLDQRNISSTRSAPGQSVWQSFTAGINGILSSVEWQMESQPTPDPSIAVNIYNGEGVNGTLLGTANGMIPFETSFVTFDLSSSNIKIIPGQLYTIQVTTVISTFSSINSLNSYANGRSSNDPDWDYIFKTYVKAFSTDSYLPLSGGALTGDLSTSGTLTAGAVTYPNTNGTQGQVLIANTNGSASWGSAPSAGVPYTGATGAINLGAYDLTVNGLTVGRGSGTGNEINTRPNTAIGFGALISNTQGTGNTSIGYRSLNKNTLGNGNSSFGESSLYNNLTGGFNSSFGSVSLYYNTTGTYNSSFGFQALFNNTTGDENTATGFYALPNNTSGRFNTAIGSNTLVNNTLGEENTANGVGSLYGNTEGDKNTAIGRGSLATNTLGNRNTAVGYYADVANDNLENATAIGNGAIVAESNTMQLGNAAVTNVNTSGAIAAGLVKISQGGYVDVQSGQYVGKDDASTAVGYEALINNNGGYNNTALGYAALKNNLTGGNNSAFGPEALLYNTEGERNTAIGSGSLIQNSIGSENTAVGNQALNNQTSGDANTAIGYQAGTGSENSSGGTFLGYRARQQVGQTLANATAIGYKAEVTASNTIQLGNFYVTNVKTNGSITAGTVTYPNTHNNISGQVLTVNAEGIASWADAAVGSGTIINNTPGFGNTVNGFQALGDNTEGNKNTANGYRSLWNNVQGNENVANGYEALVDSKGSGNTSIGYRSLNTNTIGSYNTALGYNANVQVNDQYNSTAIGYNAVVSNSNTIQLGNTDVTNVKTSGSITAGTVTYPNTNGTPGQVLLANEDGNATWGSASSSGVPYTGAGNPVDLGNYNLTVYGISIGRGGSQEESNTVVGKEALSNTSYGSSNTAFGYTALKINENGSENSAFGRGSLSNNTSGERNTAVGNWALNQNSGGRDNTALGAFALDGTTNGEGNTAIGSLALRGNTTGFNNTALGNNANVEGNNLFNSTAIGYNAVVKASNTIQLGNTDVTNVKTDGSITAGLVRIGQGGYVDIQSGQYVGKDDASTAVGYDALVNNNGGYNNTALGYTALRNNVTGYNNTALGSYANVESDNLVNSTAIGYNALVSTSNTIQLGNSDVTNVKTSGSITTGLVRIGQGGYVDEQNGQFVGKDDWSTAVGFEALINNNGGNANTAFGYTALKNNVTGANNSAFGPEALLNNTSGVRNIALGNATLYSNSTGSYNTVVGSSAASNVTGSENTAVGNQALNVQGTGDGNTAIGSQSGAGSENSSYGTFLGYGSGQNGQTLTNATAIGYNAVVTASHTIQLGNTDVTNVNTSGAITAGRDLTVNGLTIGRGGSGMELNTAIGSSSLSSNSAGIGNTAIGYSSLSVNTTGGSNTANGANSLKDNQGGQANTANGTNSLQTNTSGNFNTALGHNAGAFANVGYNTTSDYSVYLGSGTRAGTDNSQNEIVIGYNAVGKGSHSVTLGNNMITKLYSAQTSITSLSDRRDKSEITSISEGIDFVKKLNPVTFTWNTRDKAKVGIKSAGFIAQELLALQKESKIGDNLDLVSDDDPEKLEARYANLLPVMVKAIQEQQVLIETQKKQIDELKLILEKLLNEKK